MHWNASEEDRSLLYIFIVSCIFRFHFFRSNAFIMHFVYRTPAPPVYLVRYTSCTTYGIVRTLQGYIRTRYRRSACLYATMCTHTALTTKQTSVPQLSHSTPTALFSRSRNIIVHVHSFIRSIISWILNSRTVNSQRAPTEYYSISSW